LFAETSGAGAVGAESRETKGALTQMPAG